MTKVFNQLIARGNILKLLDNLLHFAEISPDEHAFMLSTAASLTTYEHASLHLPPVLGQIG